MQRVMFRHIRNESYTRYIEQFVNERNTLVYNKVLITIFRIFKENNKSCSKKADLSLECYYFFVLFHLL